MADELAKLDATAQAELVRSKKASPAELVDAAIARIEKLNPQINAVIHEQFDRARALARGPLPEGPFRGVPFLMKDLGGAQAGEPNHAGSRFLKNAGYREPEDAYFTRKVMAAGLVPLGRTNTPELALLPSTEPLAYGPTRNPWDTNHSSGGSSGGASAAVAAGLVPFAHASDGGGSIRGPASMCGLVGLKPTRGRCSFGPGSGERWSGFSCEFALTRSVRDAATLLDAVAGPMPGDPYAAALPAEPFAVASARPLKPLRIGVLQTGLRGLELHPECTTAIQSAAKLLEGLKHRVEIAHPEALEDPDHVLHYITIVSTNSARTLTAWEDKIGRAIGDDEIEPLTAALAQRGRSLSAPELLATIEYVHAFGRRLSSWWESGFDLLLTVTQGAPPPEIGYITSTADDPLRAFVRSVPYGMMTLPFNMSGQPAISLPLHWTANGLPIGVQLVAATGNETLLLAVARQLEEASGWAKHRAPVHG